MLYIISVNRSVFRGGSYVLEMASWGARIKRVYTYHFYCSLVDGGCSPFRFDLKIHLVPAERRPWAPVIIGGGGRDDNVARKVENK